MYNTEAKALFSHRADIKAKRNYIRINTKRQKANREFAYDCITFLTAIIFFIACVMVCLIA